MGVPSSVTGSICWVFAFATGRNRTRRSGAMPHEELRDHLDVAGILYMTWLCKQALIWTHVHTHYQVTRSGIHAGRVRACACLHARLATAASHARRFAAQLPGGQLPPTLARWCGNRTPWGPRGELKLLAPTRTARRSAMGGHHRESARLHTNAAAGLVAASAAYPRRDIEALPINVPGLEAIRPVSCASSTGEGGHTRAQKRQAPEPANSASSTALVVRVLLRTATSHLREFEACLSAGVAGSTRLEKTREQSQATRLQHQKRSAS